MRIDSAQKRMPKQKYKLDWGLDKVKPKLWFKYWTAPPCSYLHGRPEFGPYCTEFVYPGCWHFDNGATREINDVLTEHNGLSHVLPLTVHLNIF